MNRRRSNPLIRVGFVVVAIGFLSAFSYPLIQEGYDHVGTSVYQKEKTQMLEQSIAEYVRFNSNVSWNVNTPTRQILSDLVTGVDMSFSGKPQSLLPSNTSVDLLDHEYRIVYKGPKSYKVLPK
jgi:hypothetical protein